MISPFLRHIDSSLVIMYSRRKRRGRDQRREANAFIRLHKFESKLIGQEQVMQSDFLAEAYFVASKGFEDFIFKERFEMNRKRLEFQKANF
jgi:hypothetical protein